LKQQVSKQESNERIKYAICAVKKCVPKRLPNGKKDVPKKVRFKKKILNYSWIRF